MHLSYGSIHLNWQLLNDGRFGVFVWKRIDHLRLVAGHDQIAFADALSALQPDLLLVLGDGRVTFK